VTGGAATDARARRLAGALPVAVGGVVGGALRLGLDAAIPHPADGFPVSTLIANLSGALVLGVLVAAVWPIAPAWVRLALGTGVMGSFTTFSALAVSVVQLGSLGQGMLAAVYLVVTVVAGIAAAWGGIALGAAIADRRLPAAAGDPEVDE
jgi:fluoride exporter